MKVMNNNTCSICTDKRIVYKEHKAFYYCNECWMRFQKIRTDLKFNTPAYSHKEIGRRSDLIREVLLEAFMFHELEKSIQ